MKRLLALLPQNRYELSIIIVCLLFYFTIPVLFNYIDGIVVGTSHITALYPHYPFFYPLIVQGLMFILGSFCAAFQAMHLLQILMCCFSMIYTIRSVPLNRRKLATILLLTYTPILTFQCTVISESIFISAEILFLATIIRWIHNNSLSNQLLHFLAAAVLLFTKHTGLFFGGILPLYFLIKYLRERDNTWLIRTLKISSVYAYIFVSFFAIDWMFSTALNTTRVPLYGRPAMHIITETYRQIEDPEQRKEFREDWAAKAKDEDDLVFQKFILESENIWMEPRMKFEEYVTKKYPFWTKSEIFDYVETRLNSLYWKYLFSGNFQVNKYFVLNFLNLLPVPSNAVERLLVSHDFFYDDGLNNGVFYQCNFNDTFHRGNVWLLSSLGTILESLCSLLTGAFFIWYIFFYRTKKRADALVISLLVFLIVNNFVLTIFTVPLPRYSIPGFIVLIFMVILMFPEGYHFSKWKLRKKSHPDSPPVL